MNMNQLVGVLLGILASYALAGFVWWVLHVIAAWKIFTKAGEAGWKSIIPVYSSYITFKISWKKKGLFWLAFLGSIVAACMTPFALNADGSVNVAVALIALALLLVAAVINILMVLRKARAFGHGFGFALGMLFFEPIFTLILGFGASSYLGPQD